MIFGKLISLLLLFVGFFAISQVVFPVISFKLWEMGERIYSGTVLASPQSEDTQKILGVSVKSEGNFPQIISDISRATVPAYDQFSLTIPTMGLKNETVYVDSNDLSLGLVHLPGSALPGEKGNSFISGHSALPSFIGPKAKAIFANLPKIKKGDKIMVEADGVQYNYLVETIKTINPKDLSVIAPPDNQGRFITLMTCVPPGLNLKRLIVIGKMI